MVLFHVFSFHLKQFWHYVEFQIENVQRHVNFFFPWMSEESEEQPSFTVYFALFIVMYGGVITLAGRGVSAIAYLQNGFVEYSET